MANIYFKEIIFNNSVVNTQELITDNINVGNWSILSLETVTFTITYQDDTTDTITIEENTGFTGTNLAQGIKSLVMNGVSSKIKFSAVKNLTHNNWGGQ